MRRTEERGSVTPLIVGFAAVVAMLVAVVVDASAAYLRHEGMNAVADAAALAATEALQGEVAYRDGLGASVELDPAAAGRAVTDHLRVTGAAERFPGLRFSVEVTGALVRVRLRAPLRLPLRIPGAASDAQVTATAAAVVAVAD